eukprot:CAMPEP_0113873808 /NCGR_PEP_ID=MMETSP0780_2-20120614/3980_1 /TAXON_ID=652834 /ORGANISM="Palpitomonas bilix" /LENGTH=423 /DNA_ID=CAMNT_0000859503 /DNA_START=250 /DNA_END=1518 /DNA_ORIENTATION=- /assembly_acc=CAM_ASM_000599
MKVIDLIRRSSKELKAAENVEQGDILKRLEENGSLHYWIRCFVVVTFDIDVGQKAELVFPPASLTDEEQAQVAFHAFPDSMSSTIGDAIYFFRFARNDGEEVEIKRKRKRRKFLYGYVFSRQKQDRGRKRGFFQKSLVLITRHPFIGLFHAVMAIVGPLFFEHGERLLETTCHHISRWPRPSPSQVMELPLAGDVIETRIPEKNLERALEGKGTFVHSTEIPRFLISGGNPDDPALMMPGLLRTYGNLYRTFLPLLSDLWLLWEIMITGEPLFVFCPSPSACSEAIACLLDLVYPVIFQGDFRPYFTIHDPDFKEIARKDTPKATVLGITNPVFLKAVPDFPNVLAVAPSDDSNRELTAPAKWKRPMRKPISHAESLTGDFPERLVTKREPVIPPDFTFLRSLTGGETSVTNRGAAVKAYFRQ